MNDDNYTTVLLVIAGIVLPIAYIFTCVDLRRRHAWYFSYIAYFVFYGTLGGFVFGFAMSPGGIAALSLIFVVFIGMPANLICLLVMFFHQRSLRSKSDGQPSKTREKINNDI